jgi:hypothetical protein
MEVTPSATDGGLEVMKYMYVYLAIYIYDITLMDIYICGELNIFYMISPFYILYDLYDLYMVNSI